ncbi:type II toxin-antitoxin system VapC family toxin [Ramlibacter albus]|uniref:Type II toxin-antitoxin system VapC family toxin n=1 Tax=Ramlibacter albus TaxID=2079448 RepID=A0A923MC93_9BURK|nr:type II toxin-antitoxin system VapC family toxin [Ramlibacter albus]MBC5767733.1 type II toxin-antitoxin system VapC family toxin [Ramlibacter albus]
MAPRKPFNVVDSSAWLEYFFDTAHADRFAAAIEDTERLVIPVLVLYEVFKKVLRTHGEDTALQVAAQMQQGQLVPLDEMLALSAAKLGLPLADSIIYATAQAFDAVLWTQDQHFDGLPNVRFFPKDLPA